MIIPRVKKEIYPGGRIKIGNNLKVWAEDEVSERVLGAIKVLFASSGIGIDKAECRDVAVLTLVKYDSLVRCEEYRLTVGKGKIKLIFGSFLGGRNGAATLLQLLRCDEGIYSAIETEISDWADNRFRGLMVDPARCFIPVAELKDIMLRMAKAKMNTIHLHLMDNKAYTLESKHFPQLNDAEFGYYTADDTKEIVSYGLSIGIDCLPELELTTHANLLTEKVPGLMCETESVKPNGWAMCVGSPTFYDTVAVLVGEMAELFPYPVLHIGTDEITMYDLEGIWPDWYDCKHCHALAERLGVRLSTAEEVAARQKEGTFKEKGIDGVNQLFIHTIHNIHKVVTTAGKRMMMWNDNIDIGKPTDLPRDILIHFWRVAAPYRGPREGCSMSAFLEAGFEVINSHYPQTYIEMDSYRPEVPLNTWAPHVYPPSKPEHASAILGGEPCAWGGNISHFAYTLPGAIAFYADRLWDERPGVYESEFSLAASRLILGVKVPEDFDVFAALGGFFLPRDKEYAGRTTPIRKAYVDRITISPAGVKAVSDKLKQLAEDDSAEGRIAGIFAGCADWALERL